MLYYYISIISKNLLYQLSIISIIVLSITSCQIDKKEKKKANETIDFKKDTIDNSTVDIENFKLVDYNCLYCHSMQDNNNSIASLKQINKAYKTVYTTKSAYIDIMLKYANGKAKDSLVMKTAAFEKCMLMQQDVEHNQKDIEDLAGFLFDYQFE